MPAVTPVARHAQHAWHGLHTNLLKGAVSAASLACCCCAGSSRGQLLQQPSGTGVRGISSRPPYWGSGRHHRCRRLLHRLCHVRHHNGHGARPDHAAGGSSGSLQVHSAWSTCWAAHTAAASITSASCRKAHLRSEHNTHDNFLMRHSTNKPMTMFFTTLSSVLYATASGAYVCS